MKLKNNFAYNYQIPEATEAEINEISNSLSGYMSYLKEVRSKNDYSRPESSINLPFDERMHRQIEKACEKFNAQQLKYIFVIGIGGSSLGGKVFFDRNLNKYPQVVFFESLSEWKAIYYSDKIVLSDDVQSAEDFVILLISKSGNTTETIANFENLVSKTKLGIAFNEEVIKQRVLVISDADSKLTAFAKEKEISHLEIPKNVGGRFSVFSAVGMALVCLRDENLEAFVSDARDIVNKYITSSHDLSLNPIVKSAAVKYLLYSKGYKINNLFFFTENESLGKWLRQLYAESLGKKLDLEGNQVNSGFLPIVSIGTDDLHSILQYYFSTNQKIFTTFFVANLPSDPHRESEIFLGRLASDFKNNSVYKIKNTIYQAVKTEYIKRGLPFDEFSDISNVALMQFKMIETMLLAKLMNINCFDQPEVEGYKEEVRRKLAL